MNNIKEMRQSLWIQKDVSFEGIEPFGHDEDIFDRKNLALKLTSYLDKLREGAVIAIDAPWGEGKTWFGKQWSKYLNLNDHKTIYIDAFSQDYVDDPFLLIAAEINLLAKQDAALQKTAPRILKSLVSIGGKIVTNLAVKALVGNADISEIAKETSEIAIQGSAENFDKWAVKKFEDFEKEKASFNNYKNALESFCKTQGDKPVIIFIDELDRCKPSFAVQLIERIKHLFNVPNLVFILLINREQLENAIEGVYGSKTNGQQYLGKFMHFFFSLPKKTLSAKDYEENSQISKFIKFKLSNYDLDYRYDNTIKKFTRELTTLVNVCNLSLRQIEHACMHYVMTEGNGNHGYLAFIIVLKITNYQLFTKYKNGDRSSHKEIQVIISELVANLPSQKNYPSRSIEFARHYLGTLADLIPHRFNTTKFSDHLYNWGLEFYGLSFKHPDFDILQIIRNNFDLIDLSIEL